jgi:gamma-glutamylcyclotransferase (GGCT)/AIG2-like uncharacterized protein YtfP
VAVVWTGPRALGYIKGSWRQVAPTIISSTGSNAAGWAASLGYPALVLDPAGSAISVDVFESVDLPGNWARLDTFEGPGYERVVTTVHMPTGDVDASIYVLVQVQG